jgi:hypothetical protein
MTSHQAHLDGIEMHFHPGEWNGDTLSDQRESLSDFYLRKLEMLSERDGMQSSLAALRRLKGKSLRDCPPLESTPVKQLRDMPPLETTPTPTLPNNIIMDIIKMATDSKNKDLLDAHKKTFQDCVDELKDLHELAQHSDSDPYPHPPLAYLNYFDVIDCPEEDPRGMPGNWEHPRSWSIQNLLEKEDLDVKNALEDYISQW